MKTTAHSAACAACRRLNQGLLACDSEESFEILEKARVDKKLAKGQLLFEEGQAPEGFYCVARGSMRLFKTGSNGHEQVVRIAGSGELIGYRALFAEEPYSASAVAREESRICFFSKAAFQSLLQQRPSAAQGLIRQLSREIRTLREELLSRSDDDAETRLVQQIEKVLQRPGLFPIAPLSRVELANIIGATPETVSRILSRLEEEGSITLKGRHIAFKAAA